MKLLCHVFALIITVISTSAVAGWQDDPTLAAARSQRVEWEARFVEAVANPEIALVRIEDEKPVNSAQAQTSSSTGTNSSSPETTQADDKTKTPEPKFKRVRNFVKYLAKVHYCREQLAYAEMQYQESLSNVRKTQQDFRDVEYRQHPGLDGALKAWGDIVNEVGEQAVQEASAAYAGEEAMFWESTEHRN